MGKITVLYESQTGSTEKMAHLVAEGARSIEGMEVRLVSVHDADAAEAVSWADGLAVGTPTNLGGISWRMKKFWDDWSADNWSKVDGKLGCTFSSQGGHGGGAELACTAMNIVLMNFGFLVFGVTDYLDSLHTLHYGACIAKEPRNPVDKAVCRRLGLRLAEWVAFYFDQRPDLHPLKTTKQVDGREIEPEEATPSTTKAKDSSSQADASSESTKAPSETAVKEETSKHEHHVGPVHLLVRISVPKRNQIAWEAMARELTQMSREEPGCLRYSFARLEGSETEFFVIEEYTSQEALDIHSNSSYFKRLVPAMGKISSTISVEKALPLHPDTRTLYFGNDSLGHKYCFLPIGVAFCAGAIAAGLAVWYTKC